MYWSSSRSTGYLAKSTAYIILDDLRGPPFDIRGGWSLFEINNFGQETGKININWLLFMLEIDHLSSVLCEINILVQM